MLRDQTPEILRDLIPISEPMERIGPSTFPLPRECSATELHRHRSHHTKLRNASVIIIERMLVPVRVARVASEVVGEEGLAPPKAVAT